MNCPIEAKTSDRNMGGMDMNFIAQLGVLAVILIILVIIIKSNKELENIYMEADRAEEQAPPEIKMPEFKMRGIKMPEFKTESDPPARSQATIPMESADKGVSLFIEVLDDRGKVTETKKVLTFPYTIGRNEENDLVLDDLSVSGFHARLEDEDGRVVLYDQGSLNKLMISGRQETKIPVNGEIEVGLGNTSLRFIKEVKRSSQTLYYAGTSLMEEWH